jgi:hypothetical protein
MSRRRVLRAGRIDTQRARRGMDGGRPRRRSRPAADVLASVSPGGRDVKLLLRAVLLLAVASGVARASPVAGAPAGARVLLSSDRCGSDSTLSRARWLQAEEPYRDAVSRIEGLRGPPAVDFGSHAVLLVEMGQRPTAGYALKFEGADVDASGRKYVVHVDWSDPNSVSVAQVQTAPCLLLAVPREQVRMAVVVDQHGAAQASAMPKPMAESEPESESESVR